MNDFSHLDKSGLVTMVDVSEKKVSHRLAVAQSIVVLPDEVLQRFSEGDIQTRPTRPTSWYAAYRPIGMASIPNFAGPPGTPGTVRRRARRPKEVRR